MYWVSIKQRSLGRQRNLIMKSSCPEIILWIHWTKSYYRDFVPRNAAIRMAAARMVAKQFRRRVFMLRNAVIRFLQSLPYPSTQPVPKHIRIKPQQSLSARQCSPTKKSYYREIMVPKCRDKISFGHVTGGHKFCVGWRIYSLRR